MARILVLIVLLFTAACGGGGGSDDGTGPVRDPRLVRLDAYDAQKLRVLGDPGNGIPGMSQSPACASPPLGRAVFTGFTNIRIEDPDAPLILFGDASVTVVFGDGTVGGTLDQFFGTNGDGDVVDYAGQIDIDGGDITDGVSLDYGGVLTDADNTLVFDGTMEGTFLGDPVGALTAVDLEAAVIVSGTPLDATVIVVGETTGIE